MKTELISNSPGDAVSASARAFRYYLEKDGCYDAIGSREHLKYPPLRDIYPLEVDFDVGLRVLTRRHKDLVESVLRSCHPVPGNSTIQRKVRMVINDFHVSVGAMHYYAQLEVRGGMFVYPNGRPDRGVSYEPALPPGTEASHFGAWLEEGYDRRDVRDLKFKIERALPQKDISKYPDRYKHFKAGDPTDGFWTPEEALYAGLAFFGSMFGPGWQLRCDYRYTGYRDKHDLITAVTSVENGSGEVAPLFTRKPIKWDEYVDE